MSFRFPPTGAILLIGSVGLFLGTGASAADDRPRVEQLVAAAGRDGVTVSYRVERGVSEEALERIQSGLRVRFVHRIELVVNRGLWLVPNRVIARTVVVAEVEYESLTGRYELTRVTESKIPKGKERPAPIRESLETQSVDEMIAWMTTVDAVPVSDVRRPLPEAPLRIRVESLLGRRYVWLVFPATVDTSARIDLPLTGRGQP